jgi:hypothetical protein
MLAKEKKAETISESNEKKSSSPASPKLFAQDEPK